MKNINWEEIENNPEQYEIRIGFYGVLLLTSEMIKTQRFQLEMEQHFKQERENHELLIHAIKLGLLK